MVQNMCSKVVTELACWIYAPRKLSSLQGIKINTKSSQIDEIGEGRLKVVKRRLWFHLGRLKAEEDALTLKLEVLNTKKP